MKAYEKNVKIVVGDVQTGLTVERAETLAPILAKNGYFHMAATLNGEIERARETCVRSTLNSLEVAVVKVGAVFVRAVEYKVVLREFGLEPVNNLVNPGTCIAQYTDGTTKFYIPLYDIQKALGSKPYNEEIVTDREDKQKGSTILSMSGFPNMANSIDIKLKQSNVDDEKYLVIKVGNMETRLHIDRRVIKKLIQLMDDFSLFRMAEYFEKASKKLRE